MNTEHHRSLHAICSFLAVGLWLAWPAWVRTQSISATLPVPGKIYIAGGGGAGVVTVIDDKTHSITTIPAGPAVNEATNKIFVAHGGLLSRGELLNGCITVIDGVTNSATTVTDRNAHGPFHTAVNPSEPAVLGALV